MNVKRQALFLNSAQSSDKDLTRGLAYFEMSPPLHFGSEHKGHTPEISIHKLSYVNFFINISAALGNNKIFYSDNPADDEKYEIKIGDGSYSVAGLNAYITKAQAEAVGDTKFQILPNYNTNSTYILFGVEAGWYVYFKAAETPFALLGFTSGQYVPAGKASVANEIEQAPNTAQVASVTSVNISTNLSNSGYFGGKKSDVIYESTPNAPIGSVQIDEPNNLLWADSSALTGDITQVRVQLKDQNGDPINTNSEDFSLTISIRA